MPRHHHKAGSWLLRRPTGGVGGKLPGVTRRRCDGRFSVKISHFFVVIRVEVMLQLHAAVISITAVMY